MQVRAALAEAGDIQPLEVDLDLSFEDFGLDSVARIELLARLEDTLEIHVPQDDAIHLLSGREVVRYLGRRLS